jgi:NitT/TauT family transport system ATP-binding protein
MSARPGVFLDVVSTGWSRDRDSNIVADESFGRITGRLWSTLRAESQKSLAFGQAAGLK